EEDGRHDADNDSQWSRTLKTSKRKTIQQKKVKTGIIGEKDLIAMFTASNLRKGHSGLDPLASVNATDSKRKARESVFKNLWDKRLYVTSGLKFGGDYLVYGGDPMTCHAEFVCLVFDSKQKITGFELVRYARMGRNAKKKILLGVHNSESDTVSYCVVNWTGWK
ncbi:tRNA-splicing endonuclease subunit Sen34, partial [Entophlyctis luteolus]